MVSRREDVRPTGYLKGIGRTDEGLWIQSPMGIVLGAEFTNSNPEPNPSGKTRRGKKFTESYLATLTCRGPGHRSGPRPFLKFEAVTIMNDILLWNIFRGDAPDARLPELIQQLELESPAHRWVFFDDLMRVYPAQSTETQCSILRLLSGATGGSALELITGALHSTQAKVRETAVNCLFDLGTTRRWKTAHAFFSPNIDVRRMAIAKLDDEVTAKQGLHLLADEATRQDCLHRLYHATISDSDLPLLVKWYESGVLTREQLCWLVMQFSYAGWLANHFNRSEDEERASELTNSCECSTGETARNIQVAPDLKFLVEMFLGAEPEATHPVRNVNPAEFWFESAKSLEGVHYTPVDYILAHLNWMAKNQFFPQPLVDLLVRMDLQILKANWIPVQIRRTAAMSLYEGNIPDYAINRDLAIQLIHHPFVRRKSGQLNLGLIGALLRHVEGATGFLQRSFKLGQLVSGFWDDPDQSVMFFRSPAVKEKYRKRLLELLCTMRKHVRSRVLSTLALRLPASSLDVLDGVDPEMLIEVLAQLLSRMSTEDVSFTYRKLTVLGQLMARTPQVLFWTRVDLAGFSAGIPGSRIDPRSADRVDAGASSIDSGAIRWFHVSNPNREVARAG